MMMSGVVAVVAVRLGDVLGTRLYDNLGGFQTCVVAITIVYALILPALTAATANSDGNRGRRDRQLELAGR